MSRMFTLTAVALAAALSMVACTEAPAPPPDTTMQDQAAIDSLRGAWVQAYEAGDAAMLAGLYAADAVTMLPGMDTMNGSAAIEAYYTSVFETGTVETNIMPMSTVLAGDSAYEYGTFSGTMTPADGSEPQMSTGRYVVMLSRDASGAWRIASSMNNYDDPAIMQRVAEAAMMDSAAGGGN